MLVCVRALILQHIAVNAIVYIHCVERDVTCMHQLQCMLVVTYSYLVSEPLQLQGNKVNDLVHCDIV